MKYFSILFLTASLLSACSYDYIQIPRNQQTESFYLKAAKLETPPQNQQTTNSTAKASRTKKNEIPTLSQLNIQNNIYSLTIYRPFNESWALIEKVLTHKSIPIKDRNRKRGLFIISSNDYLKSHHQKESFLPFSVTELFSTPQDDQEINLILTQKENSIQLYVKWNEQTEKTGNSPSDNHPPPLNQSNDEALVTLLKSIDETINSGTIPLRQ